jgi:DNA-binding MarR family transcriptional regulator
MTRLYDEAMAESGIRITQLSILAALAFYGPFTVKQLANALVMDRTTLTADLKPLEVQGFLKIMVGTDRRTRVVTISDTGREALNRAIPLWQKIQSTVREKLGVSRAGQLLSHLREVISISL